MSYITTTYETTDEDGTVTSSIDLRIHYTFHKGCPATMYLCNGDPGNPAEPDGIEYVRAEYQVIGKWFPCLDVLSDWAAAWDARECGNRAARYGDWAALKRCWLAVVDPARENIVV